MGKKKAYRDFKKAASLLPLVFTNTHEVHLYTGAELIEQEIKKEGEVDPKKMYKYSYPVQIAANHENRLKRAYSKGGMKAVNEYIEQVNRATKPSERKKQSEPTL